MAEAMHLLLMSNFVHWDRTDGCQTSFFGGKVCILQGVDELMPGCIDRCMWIAAAKESLKNSAHWKELIDKSVKRQKDR